MDNPGEQHVQTAPSQAAFETPQPSLDSPSRSIDRNVDAPESHRPATQPTIDRKVRLMRGVVTLPPSRHFP